MKTKTNCVFFIPIKTEITFESMEEARAFYDMLIDNANNGLAYQYEILAHDIKIQVENQGLSVSWHENEK